jgi:hypothetical protein
MGAAVSLMLAACHRVAPPGQGAQGAIEPAPDDPVFLSLSRTLTGHADLDPMIAARTAQAFRQLFPDVARQFAALSALAASHPRPEDLLEAAGGAGQREALLAVVAAWYTGTVGSGVSAKTIAYADALMNRPVADGLYPPTYQLGGPAWWIAAPPAVEAASAPARRAGTLRS